MVSVFANGPAWAQSGRDALRVVSPFAAGGGREVLARTFLNEFSAAMGEVVIIDNRPGAGGITGTVHVAKSAPDGKTLLMTGTNHNISPLTTTPPPYDSIKDFAAVATIGTGTNVLMISAAAPFKSTTELLRYARENPGKANYASAGIGSASHLTMSYLMGLAGIDMTHIPYKSSSAAATEMLSGRVDATFVTAAEVLGYLKEPRVRLLGISSPKGSRFLPGIPALAEAGIPGFSYESWWGLLAPAGTSLAVVRRINGAMRKALADPAVIERMAKITIEARSMSPEEFEGFLKKDVETASRLLRAAATHIKE
ncbi:MAG: tripartite tricarboxylate transporter substrate-binding protein [Burkholderiales bacterium]